MFERSFFVRQKVLVTRVVKILSKLVNAKTGDIYNIVNLFPSRIYFSVNTIFLDTRNSPLHLSPAPSFVIS